MVKTRSLYLARAWIGTGSWLTTHRIPIANTRSAVPTGTAVAGKKRRRENWWERSEGGVTGVPFFSSRGQRWSDGYTVHSMCTRGMSYPNLLFVTNLNSLKDRRDKLSRSFFQKMSNPASCLGLHHLLPPRHFCNFQITFLHTSPSPNLTNKKFQSFVNFALSKYQSPI